MKKINKLIRDKIIEINEKNGVKQKFIRESGKKLENRFFDKMLEEIEEIKKSNDISEIADLLEVVYYYAKFKNFNLEEIEKIRQNKLVERGSFEKGIILLEVGDYEK